MCWRSHEMRPFRQRDTVTARYQLPISHFPFPMSKMGKPHSGIEYGVPPGHRPIRAKQQLEPRRERRADARVAGLSNPTIGVLPLDACPPTRSVAR